MNRIADLFLTFGRIGAFTFGGGYAMISLLDHECVEKKAWLTSDELMNVTVIAESTPGPIAINCATYTGYKVAGMKGAVSATAGIILPSFLLLFFISNFFENVLEVSLIANAFRGIRIAVALLIIRAAVKMIQKMVKKSPDKKTQIPILLLFFGLVLGMNFLHVRISTIYLILCSGAAGFFLFGLSREKRRGGMDYDPD
ncbi:MAG: chromate transporter [Lachnospiraceae bacterium]|jgi:chromate transporter|nr:chromate transporter [Lachnospiraceae bacterium]